MIALREHAPAKVNLYLHITSKRADGYHMLDSMVAFASVGDVVEVTPAPDLSLILEGPNAILLSQENNSVLKAASALQQYARIKTGAALALHKFLPLAAGVGGGSADAAATLRVLSRFWKISIPPDDLDALALAIGADVPACLRSQSLYMGGIGERIEAGPSLEGLHIVLVNPNIELPTASVFKGFDGSFSHAMEHPKAFASQDDCIAFLKECRNDLSKAAESQLPDITSVLKAISAEPSCLLARMSGSGATCFGLFANAALAQAAAEHISRGNPRWWVKSGALS